MCGTAGMKRRKRKPGLKDELRRFIDENRPGVEELIAFIEERYAIRVEGHELPSETLGSPESLARFVSAKIFEEEQYAA